MTGKSAQKRERSATRRRPPAAHSTVCRATGRCPGLWCRLFRRCFQAEGV